MTLSALVVDDDEFLRGVMTRHLDSLGVDRLAVASDGDAAMEVVRTQGPFDVIFLDLMMPKSDGVQFLRYLAGTKSMADIVLASSVERKLLGIAESLANAHSLRVLGVLPKPPSRKAIADLLEKRSVARAKNGPLVTVTPQTLASAIRNGHVVPYFHPKVQATTGKPRSVEALARWIDPVAGLIAPTHFIPVADAHGLIDELTMSISDQAMAAVARWKEAGVHTDLEINLSALSLVGIELPDRMSEMAQRHGLDTDRITFEITESTLMGNLSQSLDTLTRLRMKGFHLAVDDFGTGYSTLTQLKMLPLSELKIDQSFVSRAADDPEARAIIESCIGLAQQFGLISVAEGVEDPRTAQLLKNLGATLLQGYWYAKPLPPERLLEWWKVSTERS